MLESAYQHCLQRELESVGLSVQCELPQSLQCRGELIDVGYRLDMLVEECVVVENKAVEQLLPIHTAQLLTYLKLGDYKLGFLLNWNVRLMKNGIKRFVSGL